MRRLLAPLALLPLSAATLPHADRLVTNDGRILEVDKARKNADGTYRLIFDGGEIPSCPERFIAAVEIEGDMSDYVPKDDNERKKLEKGFVRYRGRWMSKPSYQVELNKQAEERRERTAELAAHNEFHKGWTKETKHFRLRSNTSPELLDFYADLLEAYYSLMNKRVGIKPTPNLRKTKMQVNIYKSRKEFRELNNTSRGVAGFFSFIDETLNFFHSYQDPAISHWIALHECTHLLTYLIEPQTWPRLWINEGIADYFGSSNIEVDEKGRLTITPGKLQIDRILTVQQAIKDGEQVPLETLFRLEKSEFHAFQYAHAWSFVFFLNNHKKYAKGFKKFFKLNYTVPSGVEYSMEPFPNQQGVAKILSAEEVRRLLLESIKVKDVNALEREWLDYIAGIEIDAPKARFQRAERRLNRSPEDLLADKQLVEEGLADLEAAIEGGLDDDRVHWVRALYGVLGRMDSAKIEESLRLATEAAPLNARYRSALGQFLHIGRPALYSALLGAERFEHEDERWVPDGEEERLLAAHEQMILASALDPENDNYRQNVEDFSKAMERFHAKQP